MALRTIADFEREARTPFDRTLSDVQMALEAGGVLFLPEDGAGGGGVRVAKHSNEGY